MKKLQKCAPNDSNGAHLCTKVRNFCAKARYIYYINVRQSEGRKKKCAIESLVREKHVLKGHSANCDIEIKRALKS